MVGVSTLLMLMRRILQTVALLLGSVGILALWESSSRPDCSIDALMMLGTATAITLGMPKPDAAAAPRRAIVSRSATGPRLAARLRRLLEALGLRPPPL